MLLLRIAARNLVQARRRTGLLMLAIGLVTSLLVLLLSLSQGVSDNLVRAATTVSAGHVNVAGFYKVTPTETGPIVTEAESLRTFVGEHTPGLTYMTDRLRGWGKLVSHAKTIQAGMSGVDVRSDTRFASTLQLAMESEYVDGGRDEVIGDASGLAERGNIILFADQARRLQLRVGDPVIVQTETSAGRTNTVDLTVVAVARDLGLLSSWVVFLPKEDVRELYQLNEDTTGALWLYLEDIDQAENTMNHLRGELEAAGYALLEHQPLPFFMKFETVTGEDWTGQKIDVTTWEDEVSFLTWVLAAFDAVTWFLVTILVALIAVGIMNTMWNAVRERTREIGTMRAIGMTRGRVMGLILCEALILGATAAALGAGLGAGIALALDAAHIEIPIRAFQTILLADTLHLSVEPSALVSSVLTLTLFTALSALWPAIRASRLRPITALQHVE
ncbi:MAG: FtsX-like permease family protein [Myxococcota bacterium]|nr:FtsX-like permease family protein [Myxococcota bacterium]